MAVASGTAKSVVRRAEFLSMHACSRNQMHVLTDDPSEADMIVLTGDLEHLAEARANQLLERFPEKTFIYSEIDAMIPFVPGVYCSASNTGRILRRTQSNIYISRYGSSMNPEVRHLPSSSKELLFSFRGRRDCRVRKDILNFPYNRPDVQVLESAGFMHWKEGAVGGRQVQKDYVETLARSHFALCPRGMGFGSIRLFEVMEMGVAPVLLADHYALPPGPDWDSFLITVPERQAGRLPELLETHKPESRERGRKARKAWEDFFAPELVFDNVIGQLVEIRRHRVISEALYQQMWPLLQMRYDARVRVGGGLRRGLSMARGLRA